MYEAGPDPYCYEGSNVLKNNPGIRDATHLEAFETVSTTQRSDELLPAGRFSVRHYRAIHHHLFQDVYAWAGRYRVTRISKGSATFCYPENIPREMRGLFDSLKTQRYFRRLGLDEFAERSAHFLTELNAIHPFREDNGRTQLVFASVLAAQAGHPLDLDKLRPQRFLSAMIESFSGLEEPLVLEIRRMLQPS